MRSGRAGLGIPAESYLGVPIMSRERALGVISVQSSVHAGRFGEADVRLLSTIAANVGAAMANAQLYEEARRRGDEMAALAEVARELSTAVDLDAVLERIAERAKGLLEAEAAPSTFRNRATRRSERPSRSVEVPTRSRRIASSSEKGSSALSPPGAKPRWSTTSTRIRARARFPARIRSRRSGSWWRRCSRATA